MIVLRMTLHDDPQDRNSDEKFVCTVQRSCYLMGDSGNPTSKPNIEITPKKFQGPPGYYDHYPPLHDYFHTNNGISNYPVYKLPKKHQSESAGAPYFNKPGHLEQINGQDHVYHVYHHYQPDPKYMTNVNQKWKRSSNGYNNARHKARVIAYQPNRKLHSITHYVTHLKD